LRPAVSLLAVLLRLLNRLGLRRRHIPVRDLRKLDEKTRQDLLAAGKQKEMIELYSSPWEDLKFFPTASFLQEVIEISRPLPTLAKIKVPILALLSSGITYTDPGITQKMLAGNAQVRTVTVDAYHWPLTEKPQQVRETIEKWCERFDS
jgi:pimeloyl-ACP methyl ester carboxylesterase